MIKKKRNVFYYIFDGVFLFLILYFVYYGFNGPNGLINFIEVKSQMKSKSIHLESLQKEKNELKVKNAGLYRDSIDLDLLEEQAKKILGYANLNETVILLKEEEY